jgi:hypothetical protein
MTKDFSGIPPYPFHQRPFLDHVLMRKTDRRLVEVRWIPDAAASGQWVFGNGRWASVGEIAERFYYITPVVKTWPTDSEAERLREVAQTITTMARTARQCLENKRTDDCWNELVALSRYALVALEDGK